MIYRIYIYFKRVYVLFFLTRNAIPRLAKSIQAQRANINHFAGSPLGAS